MPLKKGKSQATISSNIRELHSGNTYARTKAKYGKAKADKQAIAIAESTARGGKVKSGIHIKKSHRGRLTAKAKAAGMGVQEYARKHLHDKNEATRKQAQFAVNAKKFHHGGKVRSGIRAGGIPGSMDPVAGIGLGNSGGGVYGGKLVSNPKLPSPRPPASGNAHPTVHAKSMGKGRW